MIDRQKLISAIPSDLFPIWKKIDNKAQEMILSQADFYIDLDKSQMKMISFWKTRNLHFLYVTYPSIKEIRKKKLEKIENKS